MAQNDSALSSFLSYLWSRSTSKQGFACTVLAGLAATVWCKPDLLGYVGATVPQIDSVESGVGQIINIILAIALFLYRGKEGGDEGASSALKLLALGIVALACSAPQAFAQQQASCNAVFDWIPPTTREDGSPLAVTDIAEYRVAEVSGSGSSLVGKFAGNLVTGSLPVLPNTTKRFSISAVDKAGLVSALSVPPVTVSTYPIKAISDLQARATFTTVDGGAGADLSFTWTAATQRMDGGAIAAADIEYQLYESSLAGALTKKVATTTAPSATISAVKGTKRYVVLAVAKPCSIASTLSNVQVVTLSAPKPPALQVRLETKVVQQ